MKKAYLAISYSNRKLFDPEIACLKRLFQKNGLELLVFVDRYNFKPNEEKQMMETAFKEIDTADFLIAELSTKSIGVGIEMGYAFAKKMPVIYLRKEGAEYSTTAAGTANYIIEYKNVDDLCEAVEKIVAQLK